ncbi:MAG: 50S ribosomal protein L6 [Caulobacteraceae bacterium]
MTAAIEGQKVDIKGPKGALSWTLAEEIEVRLEGSELVLAPRLESERARAMWGLSRSLVANMVVGVSQGYERSLELIGVGYRAAMKGQNLALQLGFSHEVAFPAPPGITFQVPRPVEIRIAGIDKQLVGETAARIRKIRPPEPYKGKGVRYVGEVVRRKEGKKK